MPPRSAAAYESAARRPQASNAFWARSRRGATGEPKASAFWVSERPLTADEIAERLEMARSNVSNSIKELLGWDLIRRAPVMGDRRDRFAAEADIWEMVGRIAAGRKQREIDPAVKALRACVAQAREDPSVHPVAAKRLREMLEFTEMIDTWHGQMAKLPKATVVS